MPKITANSVREHHALVLSALIDGAEDLLIAGQPLTAGAVAQRAGIARNSIYRYVDSVDDLIEMVVTKRFPDWTEAVSLAVDAADTAPAKVAAFARANIEQSAGGDHQWRAALSRGQLTPSARARVAAMRTALNEILVHELRAAGVGQVELVAGAVQALVDTGVRRVDAGDEPGAVADYVAKVAMVLAEEAVGSPDS